MVGVPHFVEDDPNDPFSPIITIIAQSIEARRIDTLFAQALIGLITTLRSSAQYNQFAAYPALRKELQEVAQKYQVLKEAYDTIVGDSAISRLG